MAPEDSKDQAKTGITVVEGTMIYRINIRTAESKETSIYAHPEWPFVISDRGEPTQDYKVLFVQLAKGGAPVLRVFRPIEGSPGIFAEVMPYIHSGEEETSLISVDRVSDLRELG
jgi:hypothetical protein